MLVPIRPSPIIPKSMWFSFLLRDRNARSSQASDVGQLAEILVVLGVAAFALVDRPDISDEFNPLNPLDHLEAELILHTQPQRRAVQMGERQVVHFVSQQGLRVPSV